MRAHKFLLFILLFSVNNAQGALSLSDIVKSGSKLGDVRKTKTLYIEPFLGVNWNKWEQEVNSTPISGNLGGNSLDYNYGLNLYYTFKKTFALGYGYRLGRVNWIYSDSSGFDTDDDWTEKTEGKSKENSLIMGLSFSSFNLIYLYHLSAELNFDNFYMNDFDEARFSGTGHMVKLLFNNSFSFISLYFGQNTYTDGEFDGKNISLPDTVDSIKFDQLSTQYFGMELTFPIGIF